MSKSTSNLVRATKNTFSAAINTVGLGAQILADGTELLNKSIGQAVPCTKAVALLPFSSTKGYLIQEGVSEEEADARAYKYVRQELSVTIEAVGVGSGKLLADLLKDDLDDDAPASTKKLAKS